MFVRITKTLSSNGTVHEYVRVAQSFRKGGRPRQRTVTDLGRKCQRSGYFKG